MRHNYYEYFSFFYIHVHKITARKDVFFRTFSFSFCISHPRHGSLVRNMKLETSIKFHKLPEIKRKRLCLRELCSVLSNSGQFYSTWWISFAWTYKTYWHQVHGNIKRQNLILQEYIIHWTECHRSLVTVYNTSWSILPSLGYGRFPYLNFVSRTLKKK
jgi:hypothetical protein